MVGTMAKIDDSVKKKVPELRFKGFTDEWEERKLGEISRMYQPLTITGNDLLPDGVPVFGANGFIGFFSEANHIEDQVTISARGEGTGTPSYVHGPVWITGNSMVVNVDDFDINKYFLFANLTANSLKKYVTGGAQPQLTRDVLVKVPITLPNAEEQQKIGSFFKQLDDTIALHQHKLDLLKEQKKGFLQKMFPKNGEKVPELRFEGFTDDWEERKLNENVENIGTGRSSFKAGLDYSEQTPYEVLGSTSVISYSDSFDHSGNFVLTARVGANAGNLYKHSGNVKISDNTVYIQSKNLEFIFYLLTKYDLKKLAFGTGQPLIKASELKNLKLFFPKKFGEQQKIGSFFKQLDETIALHQRKLDLLKEQKKGFLQKMFV